MPRQQANPPGQGPEGQQETPKAKPSRKGIGGRPSKFTPELGQRILHRLHTPRARSLHDVIHDTDIKIGIVTVMNWLASNAQFLKEYRIARELQADRLVWEGKAMAELCFEGDVFEKLVRLCAESPGAAMHARVAQVTLMVRTHQWMAGKLASKKYGKMADEPETARASEDAAVNLDEALKLVGGMTEDEAARVYQDALKVGA